MNEKRLPIRRRRKIVVVGSGKLNVVVERRERESEKVDVATTKRLVFFKPKLQQLNFNLV